MKEKKILNKDEIRCEQCNKVIGKEIYYEYKAKTGRICKSREKEYSNHKYNPKSGGYLDVKLYGMCQECAESYIKSEEKEKERVRKKQRAKYNDEMSKINERIKNNFIEIENKVYKNILGITEGRDVLIAHLDDMVIRFPKNIIYKTNAPVIFAMKSGKKYRAEDFYKIPSDPDKKQCIL